jgi:hypothetical protein
VISTLSSPEIQQYIREHEHADERQLVLTHKTILGVPASLIAGQLAGRRKAKIKLPAFYRTYGIIFPPSIHIEQSSSETTALYKTEVVQKTIGERPGACADLTGGFGADTFFFSRIFKEVHYLEPQLSLMEIARHNHHVLGSENIVYYNTVAEIFIERPAEKFDLIYIDPSRRSKTNKKVFRFVDCEPDVTKLMQRMFEKSDYLLIKASPLIDIQQGLKELPNAKEVHVVSVDNECREVLFLVVRNFEGKPVIHSINLSGEQRQQFSFTRSQEQEAEVAYSEPLTYLYEPNVSVLKSGAFKLIGATFGLNKIHPNTHLYTAHQLVQGFPGRIFRIIAFVKPEKEKLKTFVTDGRAHVLTRNFPMTTEALKKKTGLTDGGNHYLIGFTSRKKKLVALATRVQ